MSGPVPAYARHAPPTDEVLALPPPPRPLSIETEQALLGALFVDNSRYHDVCNVVGPEHFYEPLHGRIFAMIGRYVEAGKEATPFNVGVRLERDPTMQEVGGPAYLGGLAVASASGHGATTYAETIRELALRRGLIAVSERLSKLADDRDTEISQAVSEATSRLETLTSQAADDDWTPISEVVREIHEDVKHREQRQPGLVLSTGLPDLDRQLSGGFWQEDLIYMAARPSIGKTTVAGSIALNVALNGFGVAFFSLEMSRKSIGHRICSDFLHRHGRMLTYEDIRQGKLDMEQADALCWAEGELDRLPLYIDDRTPLPMDRLVAKVETLRRKVRRDGVELRLLVIDWSQYLDVPRAFADKFHVAYAYRSTHLKEAAKRLKMPVLALHQLSRPERGQEERRPTLRDLRESGNLEQDADKVIFLNRPEYWHSLKKPEMGQDSEYAQWANKRDKVQNSMEMIVAKHRDGPTGTVHSACFMGYAAIRTKGYAHVV